MQPPYRHPGKPFYRCARHLARGTEQTCYGVKAAVVDDVVAEQVLRGLEPAVVALSMQATQDIQKEREQLDQHWRQQRERARYEAERARRQYDAVEPEDRLVARTLEQRWEEALRRQQQLQEDYDGCGREEPGGLTETERAQVLALSADLPTLWRAEGTTPADRKEIVRCLVERVVVHVRQDSEAVRLTIHWKGGCTSDHRAIRPVRRDAQMEGHEQFMAPLAGVRRRGHPGERDARPRNREGHRPPDHPGRVQPDLTR